MIIETCEVMWPTTGEKSLFCLLCNDETWTASGFSCRSSFAISTKAEKNETKTSILGEWFTTTERNNGQFHHLVQEMRVSNRAEYFRYFRMSSERMDHLLSMVGHRLVKVCISRKPIPPAKRLAVTIRFLASGDSQRSFFYHYCVIALHASKPAVRILKNK